MLYIFFLKDLNFKDKILRLGLTQHLLDQGAEVDYSGKWISSIPTFGSTRQ